MNKLLVPTDFTISSLNLVRKILMHSNLEKCQITLVHGFELSSSISELLFYSKGKLISELNNSEFEFALKVISNKYQSGISDVKIDLLHSSNLKYLNNYLTINEISKIYLPDVDTLKLPHKRSFNLISQLRKTNIAFENIPWNEEHNSKNNLDELFFRDL